MDSQQPDAPMEEMLDDVGDDEEIEVTREELIAALQEVVTDLSTGLKGSDRDAYVGADDLAQNDWFFAGVSDEDGQYAVTMWPAEGEEDMLRIDLGTEDDVHQLAASPDQVAALTDDFIEAMSEDYDEDDEDFDDEDEDDLDDEDDDDFEDIDEDDELEDDDIDTTEDQIGRNGSQPPL